MSTHDLNLLLLGAGIGAYTAFAAALLISFADDLRSIRHHRAAED